MYSILELWCYNCGIWCYKLYYEEIDVWKNGRKKLNGGGNRKDC